ncbi:MAG TPA: hypothetical protein VFA04_02840, partial [Bryobacteraceae bacterium]|nr:hypothetical protein [Bryobacteraceae bacterium]
MPRVLPVIILLVCFVISRVLYFVAGIRFDATPVATFWQCIDPVLMQHDLLRSLWYLHMTPPGWNLALGVVVKLFPSSYAAVLCVLYLGIGMLIGVSLLR